MTTRAIDFSNIVLIRFRWILILLPLVLFASWVGRNIYSFGVHIPQTQLGVDYAMGVLWWLILAGLILAVAREGRRMLIVAWVGKFFVALVAMLIYEQRYLLDAYGYFQGIAFGVYGGFDVSKGLAGVSPDILPSTVYLVHIIVALGTITGPYYHALKVVFAFIGLMGVWWFYRAAVVALGRPHPPLFYFLAFFPSIIFWSSILGKDPLQFLCLGIYAYGAAQWLVQGRLAALGIIGVGLAGSYLFRPWVSLMAALSLLLATLLGRCRAWQFGLLLLPVLATTLWIVNDPERVQTAFRLSNTARAELFLSNPALALEIAGERAEGMARDTQYLRGSGVAMDLTGEGTIRASFTEIIFSGLFRPMLFEATNAFVGLAALESTFVISLAVIALLRFRLGYLRDPLVLWTASYSLMWAALYGAIVMANFGSGLRYKLQMWPIFLLLLVSLTHRQGRAFLDSRLSPRYSNHR